MNWHEPNMFLTLLSRVHILQCSISACSSSLSGHNAAYKASRVFVRSYGPQAKTNASDVQDRYGTCHCADISAELLHRLILTCGRVGPQCEFAIRTSREYRNQPHEDRVEIDRDGRLAGTRAVRCAAPCTLE
eukprot:1760869-Prymnesium_polylepis.1